MDRIGGRGWRKRRLGQRPAGRPPERQLVTRPAIDLVPLFVDRPVTLVLAAGLVALDELVEVTALDRSLLQREVLVGAEVVAVKSCFLLARSKKRSSKLSKTSS